MVDYMNLGIFGFIAVVVVIVFVIVIYALNANKNTIQTISGTATVRIVANGYVVLPIWTCFSTATTPPVCMRTDASTVTTSFQPLGISTTFLNTTNPLPSTAYWTLQPAGTGNANVYYITNTSMGTPVTADPIPGAPNPGPYITTGAGAQWTLEPQNGGQMLINYIVGNTKYYWSLQNKIIVFTADDTVATRFTIFY
jgi:hypothetical protein